jgi:hypothetical protein
MSRGPARRPRRNGGNSALDSGSHEHLHPASPGTSSVGCPGEKREWQYHTKHPPPARSGSGRLSLGVGCWVLDVLMPTESVCLAVGFPAPQ